MRYFRIICTLAIIVFVAKIASAASAADYLILQDIGDYKHKTQGKDFITLQPHAIPGYSVRIAPGFLAGNDHFDEDHDDTTYETKYVNRIIHLGAEVQVIQHAGADSDKWLMHEIDDGYRAHFGLPDPSYSIEVLDGNTILTYGAGGWEYRWISGNIVIKIQSYDLQMTKPAPLEVVKAYLVKYPSSLPSLKLAALRSAENTTKWIKGEMERRLWLCDKWFKQIGVKEQKEVMARVVESMNIFLDYREKYFNKYILLRIKASAEKGLLYNLQSQGNTTALKEKLEEYKKWWGDNKNNALHL